MADNELTRRVKELENSDQGGALEERVARLESHCHVWQEIWNDPYALLRRAAELLGAHKRELAFLVVAVPGVALTILDHDHNLDGVRDFLRI